MKHYLPYLLRVALIILSTASFGQVSIDYPTDRAVFQRDKNNSATLYIAGGYTKVTDRIEAKLTAINGGENIDWTTIQLNPSGGLYQGSLQARGGWYRLEVRARRGGDVVGSTEVSHVGIGEVFMVAGQSNGQGYTDKGAQGAQDDRVSCIGFNSTDGPPIFQDLPYPSFQHIESFSDIAPRGKGAWCWGKLGDILAQRLGVPILFFNVAWYGTSAIAWRQSINGTGYSVYTGGPIEPSGMPYGNIRMVIQRYTPITGMRGVLWIQGEADNDFNTSTDTYFNSLKTVIETSRNESGKNISWMVSLTSYNNKNGSDQNIVNGQRRVINNVLNVFEGPNTDAIQIPRQDGPDGVHFMNEGLTQLAEAWADKLNDGYFNSSDPYQGVRPMSVNAFCAGNGNLNLSANNAGLSSVSWTNGQSSNSIQVGNGNYRAYARDDRGNYIFSPEIRINENIQPPQPTIRLEGSNPVCLGNTATLISSTSENVRWNTGSTSDRLDVTTGGDYFVSTRNVYGCEATSEKITMKVSNAPLPATPKVTASGVLTFCDGGEVSLTSDSKLTNIWSNGANAGSIVVKNSGEFKVRALDSEGCYSLESEAVNVKVNPLPARPIIGLSGETTFCAGGNVTLTSSYDTGNIWSTTATTKAISVTATGNFTLMQRDANGCESTSDQVSVKVNPLPQTPAITALRPTTFCLRDYTTLQSSEAFSYVWSNGETGRQIEIRNSGNFTISSKDENGCISPVSPVVAVVANPLPVTPTIAADGPIVFCADLSVNLQSSTAVGFLWSNGASTQTLKVTTAGIFSVQTINEFQCYSDPSNKITTQTLALPAAPNVRALSATTICDGDTVILQASQGNSFFWNNGEEGSDIKVIEAGDYAARVQDSKGCYSPYSALIPIDVKPSPSAPVIRQTGTYTLLAENNLNSGDHVWKFNDLVLTENTATLKAVRSGSYVVNNTIVYSPTLTCYSEFSEPFMFRLDPTVPGFVVYPNPNATGKMTVETLLNVINAEIQIVDSRGVIHKTFTVKRFDSQKVFNLSGLSSGTYFVRILSAGFNATQKLLIVQ
ncbi:T9SS type A sorting domain-containing protein [Dyadobacter sp. CY323]|uniref:T9SS type A sorting domain-containing protein n=1 Tax=Dyadobacter sp. CY323 TaxID=2907302 RepID=UPI001F311B32|nr:T9SS type A sorting domain-containing protein [Dyadobacter sp. CY323]MCE6990598.1 T9SS type A sorting domain-containing protein [Dyadobacter sp. CY323]